MTEGEVRVLTRKIQEALEAAFDQGYIAGDRGTPRDDAFSQCTAWTTIRPWMPTGDGR